MKLFIFFLTSLISLNAFAEGGCPPGQYPQQGQGWQTCVPIPGAGQSNAPSVVPGYWTDSWGALATYEPLGVIGVAAGLGNKEDAEQEALADCKRQGGKSCRVDATYENSCVALAGSHTGYSIGGDADLDVAKKKALEKCRSRATKTAISLISPVVSQYLFGTNYE